MPEMAYYMMMMAPLGYYVTKRIVNGFSDRVLTLEPLLDEDLDVEGLLETAKGILSMYSAMQEDHPAFVSKELITNSVETLERHIRFAKQKSKRYYGWADFHKENKRIKTEVRKLEKRLSRFISTIQISVRGSEFNTLRVRHTPKHD